MASCMKDIETQLRKSRLVKGSRIFQEDLLSTGYTPLNLAISGCKEGGFAKGFYYFWVGDSSSGKTFFARTLLAEACINPHFDKYRLIYDDIEDGALMDIRQYFGRLADRLESPAKDKSGKPIYSELIEDFYFNVDDACQVGKPFIYILDSMDALSSVQECKKFDEKKSARRKNKEAPGEYTDGKAKINSGNIRKLIAGIRDTKSILVILNQTRDNIKARTVFDPKQTFAGGWALQFYATVQLWSSVAGSIKRTIKSKERKIGIGVKVRVKKNRTTGRDREVSVPIYYSTGIDDIGGCVSYLVSEGHWSKNKQGVITAKDFGVDLKSEALIHHIEDKGLEFELRDLVSDVWQQIEEACLVKRKNRYG